MGVANLYQKAASGAGEETLLLKSDYPKFPTDWSRDGRFIIYRQTDPKTKSDVWVLPEPGSGEAKPFPVVRTEANETAGTLSPDGRWLAYASDVSGRYEVYVQSFPGGGGKRQVSTGGGNHPRWRRDGRELFYYAGDGKLMAAPVRSGESFEMGAAVSLFEFRAGTLSAQLCALCRNGRRAAVSDQRSGGDGAERAADGGGQLGGGGAEMMMAADMQPGPYEIGSGGKLVTLRPAPS